MRSRYRSTAWSGGTTVYSQGAESIFGVPARELEIGNREYVERYIHPDDRQRVAYAFAALERGANGPHAVHYRIFRRDGGERG